MNKMFKLLTIAASFSIVGCANMLEASKNLRESLDKTVGSSGTSSSSVISATPSQICQAYKDNSVNAARLYKDKRISFKAKALTVSGDGSFGYSGVDFKVKDTEIVFLTKDHDKVSKVIKGKTYTATGSIHSLEDAIDTTDLKIRCKLVVVGNFLI